jgi:hypothetical protein
MAKPAQLSRIKYGLFADPGPVASQLLANINGLSPGSGRIFPLSQLGLRLSIDGEAIFFDGIDLTTLDAVWIQGFSYQNPVVPAAKINQDWTLWQIDHLIEQQTYSSFYSLFQELDRRGVMVINPPWVHVRNFSRFALLERVRHSGFQVPPLLCSNQVESVDAFCQHHGDVVWRPACGLSSWQRFTAKQQADLVGVDSPPILLAKVVAGPLNNSYFLNGNSVLSLQHQAPDFTPPMERLEQFWPVDNNQAPDPEQLLQVVGGYWLKVTYITDGRGAWIYDLDSDPVLSGLPELFSNHLLLVLAEQMTGQADLSNLEAKLAIPQERSNMFLRRMYRILFDMEAIKYS